MILKRPLDLIAVFDELNKKAKQAKQQRYQQRLQNIKQLNPNAKMNIKEIMASEAKVKQHLQFYTNELNSLNESLKALYFLHVDTENLVLTFFKITKALPQTKSDKPNVVRCSIEKHAITFDMKEAKPSSRLTDKFKVEDLAEMEITAEEYAESVECTKPPRKFPRLQAIIDKAFIAQAR